MTDKGKLIALLDEWGVPYKQQDLPVQPGERNAVVVTVGLTGDLPDNPAVTGYSGFFTDFEFTEEGEFLTMGAWE
jgi:hypothetical protein